MSQNKVTNLQALVNLAQRAKAKYATKEALEALSQRVDALPTGGGQGHLTRAIVASADAIDTTAQDADKYIYMAPKANAEAGNEYDEYMVIGGKVERIGDTGVDLSGYVQKAPGKGLSTNDYTDEDKAKLAGLEIATEDEVNAVLDVVFGTTDQGTN